MNAKRQTQLLGGQSALARKTFHCVPVEEPQTIYTIMDGIKAKHGSCASFHTIRACLGALEEQGLIKQPTPRYSQRVDCGAKQDPEMKPTLATVMPAALKTDTPEKIDPPAKATPEPVTSPLALLADISADMVEFAAYSHKTLKSLAERISEAALIIEQQRETDAAHMTKVRQLRALLAEIGSE
jgi:hypothetical protein